MEIVEYASHCYALTWHPNKEPPDTPIQVSGYVFEKGRLLLTRTKYHWTIPGGKPEKNETPIETLRREILEETQVEIKNIFYLGYVSSRNMDTDQVVYQMRYKAQVNFVRDNPLAMETDVVVWVKPEDLHSYLPWAKGKVFQEELKAALGCL